MNETLVELNRLRSVRDAAYLKMLNSQGSDVEVCKSLLDIADGNYKRFVSENDLSDYHNWVI
jgi:hypothetical protein